MTKQTLINPDTLANQRGKINSNFDELYAAVDDTISQADADGRYVRTVNGVAPDVVGDVVVSVGPSGSSTFAGLSDKATADLPAINTPLADALALKTTVVQAAAAAPVQSVAGLAGDVVLRASDVGAVANRGEHASSGALASAWPPAASKGAQATVAGVVHVCDGVAWGPDLTVAQRQSVVSGAGNLRAAGRFSPSALANGAIPSALDTGQPLTFFASPSAPSPLVISSGAIAHTPFAGAQSAGYMQADMGAQITRAGAMVLWPTSALGVFALVFPSAQWSSGVLPNAGFHLVVFGNGLWTLTRFTTGGSTTLASNTTHGRPATAWGTGLQPIDVVFDAPNSRCLIKWWDGTVARISSAFFASETSRWAIWELYETNGATDVPAVLGDIWANATPIPPDSLTKPLLEVASNAAASRTAAGAIALDFSMALHHEVTLNGAGTSVTFSGARNRYDTYRVEFVQDATGSRTVSGWASSIKFAGGAAPALTVTPNARDIFTFRWTGSLYVECGRSLAVPGA